jgi:hypothetical protein
MTDNNDIRVVVTTLDMQQAQQAIRDGYDLGWKLMSFDMTQFRPVVIFERPRKSGERQTFEIKE